jgi:methionine-R-sulfoxide reductase
MKKDELKSKLTPGQYAVMAEKGTEAPFSGKFLCHSKKGMYACVACGAELFSSENKFELPEGDPNSGWPSFHSLTNNDAVKLVDDNSHGMIRTEVTCANCGGHLGHLFNDGPTDSKEHYCINSCTLDFKPKKNEPRQD